MGDSVSKPLVKPAGEPQGPKKMSMTKKISMSFASKSLSNDDLEYLKFHTNYDEKAIRKWHAVFMKDCPKGYLEPSTFLEKYQLKSPTTNVQQFCEHIFRTFDTDKNGFIDFKEFMLAINITASGTAEEKLKWTFHMYDVDGDGVIDVNEMTKIVEALSKTVGYEDDQSPLELAKSIFSKMDINKDGSLTKEEFIKGCLDNSDMTRILSHNSLKNM